MTKVFNDVELTAIPTNLGPPTSRFMLELRDAATKATIRTVAYSKNGLAAPESWDDATWENVLSAARGT